VIAVLLISWIEVVDDHKFTKKERDKGRKLPDFAVIKDVFISRVY
jgi:hypothetical protein